MPDLDAEIARAVDGVPGIAVLVVFGSRARGSHRADSNLDVGVLPERGLPEARRRYLQADVAAALGHLAPAPAERVDVVLLDEATDLLRQRIMETGRVVLCRDARAWRDLRVRTMWEYGDRNGSGGSTRMHSAAAWKRGSRVVDRDVLSSRLSALESYLVELRYFGA